MKKTILSYFMFFLAFNGFAQTYKWTKTIAGSDDQGISNAITDHQGNVIMLGSFRLFADFDPGPGKDSIVSNGKGDCYITKWNSDGVRLWTRTFGGLGEDNGAFVTVDANDNIYITGNFTGTVDFDPGNGVDSLKAGKQDAVFIAKYNSAGKYAWAKSYLGKTGNYAMSIAYDGAKNLYVSGIFKDTTDFNPGPTKELKATSGDWDIFLTSLDTNGNYRFTKTMGSVNADFPGGMAADVNHNIYLTGWVGGALDLNPDAGVNNYTPAGKFEMFFIVLNVNGAFQYSKTFPGSAGSQTNDPVINIDQQGNIVIAGTNAGWVDFNTGTGVDTLSNRAKHNFVLKMNNVGAFVWLHERVYGSSINAVVTDPNSNIYLIDQSISKYDINGKNVWDVNFGPGPRGAQFIYRNTMCNTPGGDIYVGGLFAFKHDFDFSSGIDSIASYGSNYDGYLMKMYEYVNDIKIAQDKINLQLFPNPATSSVTLISSVNIGKYKLFNTTGVEVLKGNILQKEGAIQIKELPSGLYSIVFENEQISGLKLLVKK